MKKGPWKVHNISYGLQDYLKNTTAISFAPQKVQREMQQINCHVDKKFFEVKCDTDVYYLRWGILPVM